MENINFNFSKLLEFQKRVGAIAKDSQNPFFKSNYFDINKLIDEIKPILNELGLILMQPLTNIDGKAALQTVIIDAESNTVLSNTTTILPENSDPQKMGSIITYFRRYAITSLLLLSACDTDGEIGQNDKLLEPIVEPRNDAPRDYAKELEESKPKIGDKCAKCGAEMILNPNTGKIFCKDKCWLKTKKPF